MQITNREEYKEVAISTLGLSTRTFNCLKRAGYSTLYLLIENYNNLSYIRNMGAKSLSEIDDLLWNVSKNGVLQLSEPIDDDESAVREEETVQKMILPPEILSRPATDLNVSGRICNLFHSVGIETIEQVLTLHPADILHMRNMGVLSVQQLKEQIELLNEMGEDYFAATEAANKEETNAPQYSKRELDIATVKKLQNSYGFKSVWLCDWYGLSRQRIHQKLAKRINRGNWCGKQLLPAERTVITEMINTKSFYCVRDDVKYYLVNNMADDCAFLIVSAEDIKCFFLDNLPDALQARIKLENLDRFSEKECAALDALGRKVFIMKKPHFMPNDSSAFRNLASARGLTAEDYALFLMGIPYCPANISITDERIISFLEENTIDGRTFIPSTPDNQWIRSYISRSPYSTEQFIEFFGFSTTSSEDVANLDFTAADFRSVEDDMRSYDTGADYVSRIFAEYPLIGSKIISQKNLDILYQNSRKYIGQLLNKSDVKLCLKAEMQITLAVINYAKEWDTEDESGFWRFITTSFGYRDESGQLRNSLCNCVKDALIRNRRWFVVNDSGNHFKSSIVVHALTTKKSWLYFCDFLFDFYKTNLDWEYIEDDPMIARMVLALRNKMRDTGNVSDKDIEISSKIYCFREGIMKLIIYRPKYATKLVATLLKRIDGLVNHTAQAAANYEEQLCDEWMENKLQRLSTIRRRSSSTERHAVAIDYTRIKPVYQLHNETEIRIVFPDVRLTQNDFSTLRLIVYCGGRIVEQRTLGYYGNEFGKTMSGFTVKLEDYMLKSGSGVINPHIIIICDDKEIYNSEKVLERDCLVFRNKTEADISSCEQGGYSVFVPYSTVVEFVNAEVGVIKENPYIKGYFVNLQKDFIINIDGELTTFDNAQGGESLRLLISGGGSSADYIINSVRYSIVSGREIVHIVSVDHESEKKYQLVINSDIVDLGTLPHEESGDAEIYKIEIGKLGTEEVSLRLIDLANERLLRRQNFKIIRNFNCRFNRLFYFSSQDFRDAKVKIIAGGSTVHEYPVTPGESRIRVQYQEGDLEIQVPIIKVIDNTNVEWNGTNTCWIKNIPQERFLYVKAPAGLNVDLKMNEKSIGTEGHNAFALGNAIYGFSNTSDVSWLKIVLEISQDDQNIQRDVLGKVAAQERFVETPKLRIKGTVLSWDCGYGFIGDTTGEFLVTVCEGTEPERSLPLNLDEEIITEDMQLPLGEYKYTIKKQSGNLFSLQMIDIVSGSLFVGDVNELRFLKHIIQIDTITFEDDGKYEAVKIRPCYIDHIEYKGIQYCGSEDRECPVYSGIMFFVGDSGKRHEYSFVDRRDEKGHQIYQVNPVRIVYINDSTLSITLDTGDPENPGDGFYYYRYYDKYAMVNVYQITDWEPTKFNEDKYYLADLYSYTRKGV